jgi:hypothetical protein
MGLPMCEMTGKELRNEPLIPSIAVVVGRLRGIQLAS